MGAPADSEGDPGDDSSDSDSGGNDPHDDDGHDDDDDDGEAEEKLDVGTAPEDPDPEDVCLGEEPSAERLAVFDCEPCSENTGLGTQSPRWVVARVDVPSYPYRVEAIAAVVGSSGPATLVYFEHNSLAPPVDPVFESVVVEGSTLPQLHVAQLDQPLIIEESERLFVGVYLEGTGDRLADCDDTPDGDPHVWIRDDPPVVHPWQALNNFTPQVYAYGQPA